MRRFRVLPLAAFLAVCASALAYAVLWPPVALAATALDDTEWLADDSCFIRSLYLYADGEAEIEFADDLDFGWWYLWDEGRVLSIEFEFFYNTFVGIFDGSNIRAAHAYTFSDEDVPYIENCTFYRG